MDNTQQTPVGSLARTASGFLNPTRLDRPAFLLNVPFSLSTEVANNKWMEDLPEGDRIIDHKRALLQFEQVYGYLADEALVYLLPTPRDCSCQDLVYTANLGVVLEHLPDRNTVVISRFASAPRRGETAIGARFFESMGYDVFISPFEFEGEAELKHLHDNVYIGGYGIRSAPETYDWMEQTFDMKVIKVELVDEYMYHLDCAVFPLTTEECMVCTEIFTPEEIAEIEQHTDIIDVPADACYAGITNSVRVANTILNSSNIVDMKRTDDEYAEELNKNRLLEDIAADRAFDVAYVNISEFHKSGALLSCMVMHLNRVSYAYRLL